VSRAPRPQRRRDRAHPKRRTAQSEARSADDSLDSDPLVPQYTVRAVAERLGVPTATLRSWNQRYGVGPPGHTPGRHRLYSETDIAILQQMNELILRGVNPRSAAQAAMEAVTPSRADTASLLAAAFELDVDRAGQLIDRHLRHYGVLDTWNQLVRPAFAAIETQQDEGVGCIDVEHALSWTVARSLQRLPLTPPDGSASIILACTEKETHTLPLEALRAALGERDRTALMLGAAVPPAALLDALGRQAQRVTVVLWAQTRKTADVEMVTDLVAARAHVMVGGPGWESTTLPRATVRIGSLSEALRRLGASG
jgi:MerR family transcriptional regulator, light-induced transcriptional regulator